ncbi:MAG: hypothetical protein AAF483_00360 [Planctomycetota bacterium]
MYFLAPQYLPAVPDTVNDVLVLNLEAHLTNGHLFQVGGGHVIVSTAAKSIIDKYEVCPSMKWAPFQLEVNGESHAGYFRISADQTIIVDMKRIEATWILEGKVIRGVEKWAFLSEPKYDLFYCDASTWLASDGLAEELKRSLNCPSELCRV